MLSRVVLAPLAGVSAVASLLALFFLVLSSAYHLIRQFVALACLAQAAVGASWFFEWVCRSSRPRGSRSRPRPTG